MIVDKIKHGGLWRTKERVSTELVAVQQGRCDPCEATHEDGKEEEDDRGLVDTRHDALNTHKNVLW